jgi:hypothetical protein
MALNMARVGVPVSMVELSIFPTIAALNIVMTAILLRNIQPLGKAGEVQ